MDLATLKQLPLFAHLTEEDCRRLERVAARREYPAAAPILEQGTQNGGFHIILSGSVRVMVEGEPRVQLAVLGAGEFFGEIAAVTGDPHGATVEAVTPAVTVEFSREGLLDLLDCSPGLNRHVLETLARRVKRTNRRVQEVYGRETALVSYLSAQATDRRGEVVAVSAAGRRLRDAAAALAWTADPVILVGESGVGKVHVAAFIHYEGPRRHRPLVSLSAGEWSTDTWELHLRLAEGGTLLLKNMEILPQPALRTVLNWLRTVERGSVRFLGTYTVGEDEADALGGPLLDAAALDLCHCSLLRVPPLRERREDVPPLLRHFLRQAGKLPGAAGLSDVVTPEALRVLYAYPYLQGNVKELAVVVRSAIVMAGDGPIDVAHLRLGTYRRRHQRPTVGLALGGGVVRGIAHVGVLQVLTESGIPIDCIAGTSAGAMAGGLFAAGMTPAEMEQAALRMRWLDLVRPVLPVSALVHNRPTVRFVENLIGPARFIDLKLPFAAVAADFRTAQPAILREGLVSEAIQASTAIPGLVQPVRRGDQFLVDGFVVSTVPVLVARSLGADVVVAVDLGLPSDGGTLSRTLGFSVLRALDIMSRRQAERELDWADVVITATDPTVSAYSFRSAAQFLSAGLTATREALPRIRRRLVELAEASL